MTPSNAGIETATRMGPEYAKLLPDSANVLDNVRGNLTDLFKAQPAGTGRHRTGYWRGHRRGLRRTRTIENSYLGETGGDPEESRAAVEIAGELTTEKATNPASDVAEAAADGARKEGLTMDERQCAGSHGRSFGQVLVALSTRPERVCRKA